MNKTGIKAVIALILVTMIISQSNIPIVSSLIGHSTHITAYAATASNSIKLNCKTLTLKEGESQTLKVAITLNNIINEKATWSSSNKKVATVSSTGNVKAIKAGRTIITVKTNSGKKAVCKVTVKKPIIEITALTLNLSTVTMDIDDTIILQATVTPMNATDTELTWSSNDENIAYVDQEGTILPIEIGTAIITVESANGIKASCMVNVTSDEKVVIDDSEDYNYVDEEESINENSVVDDENDKTDNTSDTNIRTNDVSQKVTLNAGTYCITLKESSISLDVNAASNANGANVQVYESNNTNAQIWMVENHEDGTVSFIPQCATDKVLDVLRMNNSLTGALQAGCNVDIYNHNDFPAQHFFLEQYGDGSYVIRLNSDPNLVIQAASAQSGANVGAENYDRNNSLQRWNITSSSAIAEPIEQKRLAYVCNTAGVGVFVRDQGSTAGSKVGGFTEGQEITVIGDIVNGWYKVEGTDRFTGAAVSGYSYGEYITFTKATSTATNLSFNIRATEPALNDYHYYSAQNIYVASDFGMPNCTAYAWGRIWEIYGTKLPSGYFINNAYSWWDDNIKSGKYKYGSEPRVGAIAVWTANLPYSDGCGHVAIVEKIEGGNVYVSQSYYNGMVFKYAIIGSTGYLRGYIYVDQPNY